MPLSRYTGPWTSVQARHLLRRTTFGLSRDRIDQVVDMGMDAAVDYLLRPLPLPDAPLNRYDNRDDHASIGETWVDKAFDRNEARLESFYAWMIDLMMAEGNHIGEKLTLFWHNHFVVDATRDARYVYRYRQTLREHAMGDLASFIRAITVDPGMLRYLNGRDNVASSPNENYARELLELFTVGKGPLAGPGDYTTFTEDDVQAIARVLTGWVDRGYRDTTDAAEIKVDFIDDRHDSRDKVLSHRFGGAVISQGGASEIDDLIDIILESPFVATHVCQEVYRFFVHHDISDSVFAGVIEPWAASFREGGYQIRGMLQMLFTSDLFYRDCMIGTMIRNPLDFILHTVITLPTSLGTNEVTVYESQVDFLSLSTLLQMEIYKHPDVAGWKAYYQAPSYYRLWINSVTLPIRANITDGLIRGDDKILTGVDILGLVNAQPDPYDINALITSIAELVWPRPISAPHLAVLKELVIPGLPDFEWTVEYTNYVDNPEDFPLLWSIRLKIQNLLIAMLRMPAYHLS